MTKKPKDERVERLVADGVPKKRAAAWIAFYDKYKPTTLELIHLMDETDPGMIAAREKARR